MEHTVTVTAEDITEGQAWLRADPRVDSEGDWDKSVGANCAVARALTRVAGKPARWGFTTGCTRDRVRYFVVVEADYRRVAQFVNDHDRLKPVEPFEFRVVEEA